LDEEILSFEARQTDEDGVVQTRQSRHNSVDAGAVQPHGVHQRVGAQSRDARRFISTPPIRQSGADDEKAGAEKGEKAGVGPRLVQPSGDAHGSACLDVSHLPTPLTAARRQGDGEEKRAKSMAYFGMHTVENPPD